MDDGFARALVRWQARHGRRGLPWQDTRDPYRIWLAEVMLQQTQVATVKPYFARFLERFPDLPALARAPQEEVLRLWSGLGYYARARNLHRAAKTVLETGEFPRSVEAISRLPGIGRSTAGAIAAFAFGVRAPILDGNVRRVLARCFGVEGAPRQWKLAESLLPARGIEAYTQALMDLGATVCTRASPACGRCPVARRCVARKESRIDRLPSSRPRKHVPVKSTNWLVLVHGGRVLLERRPPSGIWGGLWSFPESGGRDIGAIARSFGCAAPRRKKLPVIEHAFSHFRLRAQPILVRAGRVTPRAEESGRLWVDLEDAPRAAVPAPVKRLLLELRKAAKSGSVPDFPSAAARGRAAG
jgi:A/G-specific adenine glycosylase